MHNDLHQQQNISLLGWLHRGLLLIGLIAAALLIWYIAHILLLGFVGVLLAIFLRSLSDGLHQYTGIPSKPALGVVLLVLLVLLGVGGWLLIPHVANQMNALLDAVPQTVQQAEQRLANHPLGQRILEWVPQNTAMMPDGTTIARRLGGLFSTTLGILGSGMILVFLAIYLAIEPNTYIQGCIRLVPPDRRARAQEVFRALGTTLRRWLLAKLLAMLVIGVLTTIGLTLLGMPLALVLGIIAALLSFIPNIGPVLAEIPAVLIALNEGPAMALWVLLLYLGIQAIESYLLLPMLLRESIELPPVLVLLSVMILGSLFGLLGVFVAAPFVASLLVLVEKLYIEDTLENRQQPAAQADESQAEADQGYQPSNASAEQPSPQTQQA